MRRSGLIVFALASLLPFAGGSPVAAIGPVSAEQQATVRSFVRNALDELGIPGAAVVIVGSGGIEFAEGFGTARDDGTPATPQTPFKVASLSKQLTSIAAMQLVASGALALDATVHSYVDWFGADGSATARMTVRDLLAQTSGLSANQGLTNRIDDYAGDDALERNVRRLASEGPAHPAGEFEYSNANYDILGYLVAMASGQTYEAYMQEHVLEPLAMTHTHLTEADAQADGAAQGHYLFFGQTIGFEVPFVRGSLPSSFIAASAEDLGHVLLAHLNQGTYQGTQVLDAASMAALRQPLVHPEPWSGYGWGWYTYPLWDAARVDGGGEGASYSVPLMMEHGGGHATFASGMLLLPKEEIGVVVLMNLNDDLAGSRFYQLHPGIAKILLGQDAPQLTSYDELLAQNGRLVTLAWVALLLAFVAWSVRRYRRWSRDPATAPHGARSVLRRIVVPLVIVVAQLVALWLLLMSESGTSFADFPRLVRLSPDVGGAVTLLTAVSIAWIVIGTIWAVRLLRSRSTADRSVRTQPAAE